MKMNNTNQPPLLPPRLKPYFQKLHYRLYKSTHPPPPRLACIVADNKIKNVFNFIFSKFPSYDCFLLLIFSVYFIRMSLGRVQLLGLEQTGRKQTNQDWSILVSNFSIIKRDERNKEEVFYLIALIALG